MKELTILGEEYANKPFPKKQVEEKQKELTLLEDVFSRKVLMQKQTVSKIKEKQEKLEAAKALKQQIQKENLMKKFSEFSNEEIERIVEVVQNLNEDDIKEKQKVFIYVKRYEDEINKSKTSRLPFFLNDIKTEEDKITFIEAVNEIQNNKKIEDIKIVR